MGVAAAMISIFHRCAAFACGDVSDTDTNTAYWWATAERDGWHLSIAGHVWAGQRAQILAELGETERQRLARVQDERAEHDL